MYQKKILFFIAFLVVLTFIIVLRVPARDVLPSFLKNGETSFQDIASTAHVSAPLSNKTIFDEIIRGFQTHVYIHSGAAWGDVDMDGCMDLYVANTNGKNKLYKNDCNGTFTDAADTASVSYDGTSTGVAFGDIDNDGCLDLYIANHMEANVLYKNKCDGTFFDVTDHAGIEGEIVASKSVAWVDFDNDGYLDIFVANGDVGDMEFIYDSEDVYIMKATSAYDNLYRNNRDGTFTDVAKTAGIAGPSMSMTYEKDLVRVSGISYGSLWLDYNRDGCMDAFVYTDTGVSPLYENNCDGTFTDVTNSLGLNKFYYAMGAAASDINSDGYQDLYVSNGPTDLLFVNYGGIFKDEAGVRGIREKQGVIDNTYGWAVGTDYYNEINWGVIAFDFDNDSDKDLYVAAAGFFADVGIGNTNVFYVNKDGTYKNSTKGSGLENTLRSTGIASSDFDNDGDIDMHVTNMNGPNNLFENMSQNQNHWLKISLTGRESNSLGIGAEIELTSGDTTWVQQMTSGGSYLSQNEYIIHFGLGEYDMVDSLKITWPSGTIQTLNSIEADQLLTIIENN